MKVHNVLHYLIEFQNNRNNLGYKMRESYFSFTKLLAIFPNKMLSRIGVAYFSASPRKLFILVIFRRQTITSQRCV